MQFAFVSVAAAPVRKKAAHTSEMVNQLLFGEQVQVLKKKEAIWVKVRSLHDGYEGWLQRIMLKPIDDFVTSGAGVFAVAERFGKVKWKGIEFQVPAGALLPCLIHTSTGDYKGRLGDNYFSYSGRVTDISKQKPSVALLSSLARNWVNAPYLWGGRTPLGVDCSGLVQIIYRQMGIALPRDAWQQATSGKEIKNSSTRKAGDLVFFERDGKIIHVGIVLPGNRMIHSSGKVKIDMIKGASIIDNESGCEILRIKKSVRVF